MDPYSTLGVDRNATVDEIKKAYRDLSKKLHPDMKTGDEEEFKKVSEAYEILSDRNKKNQFDRYGTIGQQRSQQNGGEFNIRNVRRNSGFHPDIAVRMRMTLKNAVFGGEIKQKISRLIACKGCHGNGAVMDNSDCPTCNGEGGTIYYPNPQTRVMSTCHACGGTGKKITECQKCDGVGYDKKTETVKIKIPKNIENHSKIRLTGKGNEIYHRGEHHIGSYYFVVDYPDKENGIQRSGKDIYMEVKVPIDKILAEDTIKVKVFDKKEISIDLKSNYDFTKLHQIKEDFLPKGTIYVKVLPHLPTKYVSEEKRQKLVEEIREVYGKSESTLSPELDTT